MTGNAPDTILATLTRGYEGKDATLGMLKFQGVDHRPIFTLENAWLDNRRIVSCIPKDTYILEKYSGTKYKDVFIVRGVRDRDAILMHPGNTEKDTDGCILPGLTLGYSGATPFIGESRAALDYIKQIVGDKTMILMIK